MLCGFGIQRFCRIYLVSLTFTLPPADPQGAFLPRPQGLSSLEPPFRVFCCSHLHYNPKDACFLLLLKLLLSPRLILLLVVCSQHLGSCQLPPCPRRPASISLTCTHIPTFRLLSVCGVWAGAVRLEGPAWNACWALFFGFC